MSNRHTQRGSDHWVSIPRRPAVSSRKLSQSPLAQYPSEPRISFRTTSFFDSLAPLLCGYFLVFFRSNKLWTCVKFQNEESSIYCEEGFLLLLSFYVRNNVDSDPRNSRRYSFRYEITNRIEFVKVETLRKNGKLVLFDGTKLRNSNKRGAQIDA